jgi:outer-membrane receptor for ferric coprogen and ferric-rhodotorulic acid
MDHTPMHRPLPHFNPVPVALAVVLAFSQPAMAQTPSAPDAKVAAIAIAAQPLGAALNELSAATGTPIAFSPALVAGKRAPAVSGNLTALQALSRLLAGSGLFATAEGSTLVIRAAPTASESTLPVVAVTASAEPGGTTEGTGSYTTRASGAGTGMELSLREIPQSVSVITRQQIDDQNLVSLNDVLRQTPGIVADRLDERVSYSSRGFELNTMIDGIPTLAFNSVAGESSMISTAIYDRVEVIRGAAGLLNGVGSPGGSINLVRKRPTSEFSGYVSGGFGSWNRDTAEADLGGKLNASGTVRGRAVASHSDGDTFTDYKERREDVFYGAVEIDVVPSTTVALGYEHQKSAIKGANFGQTPLFYTDGSRTHLPVSFNSSAPWSTWDMTTDRFFMNFEHHLDKGWRVKAEGAFAKNSRERTGGDLWLYPSSFDPVTQEGVLDRGYNPADGRNKSFDLFATGPFELFGRTHQASFGLNVNHYTYSVLSANSSPEATDQVPVSLYGIGTSPQADFKYPILRFGEKTQQRAIYGSTRLHPTDDLSVIVGGRVTWYRNDGYSTSWTQGSPDTTFSAPAKQNGVFTPYFGVVYDMSEEFSVYASYTDIFQPNTAKDVNNHVLDPKRGHNVELGIKGEHMGGKLNTSFAVFLTQEDNLAVNIDGAQPLPDGTVPSRAVKGAHSKGFETTVSGELSQDWQIMGGYTQHTKRDANDVLLNTSLPRRLLRISTSYRLPGEWNKLTIGGSVSYQSSIYYDEAYGLGRATQGGITLLGLMARYDFTKQLSASLNIENLADKRYYSGLGGYNGYVYGNPRNSWLKASYKF